MTATLASEKTVESIEERKAIDEAAAEKDGFEEPSPAPNTVSFAANRIDSEQSGETKGSVGTFEEPGRGQKRRRVTVVEATDKTAVRNQSENVRGSSRVTEVSQDSQISDEEALALLGATPQTEKSESVKVEAPVRSKSEGAKLGAAIVGDVEAVENAADKTERKTKAPSPVRSDESEIRKTSNPGKNERKKAERKTAQKRSKSSKSGRTSPAQQVREMIDDLKRQMVDREGPFVELGVSQRSDGTLTANTLAFERELEAKGLDRMLVTRELSGFQVQPILSVDWSRSLFALAVSP